MAKEKPHMKLFYIRYTVMAFHALVWSCIWHSVPELSVNSSSMTTSEISRQLKTCFITGAVCLGVLAILCIVGFSLQSIRVHFILIILHSLGILLVIIAIVNYWNVMLLWIPTVITCILPLLIEIINLFIMLSNNL